MKPAERSPEVNVQARDVSGRSIGQVILHVRPDPLIGVEFRRVSRKPMNRQAWVRLLEGRHILSFVNRPPIPQQVDRTPEMPQEIAKKQHHLGSRDVLGMNLHVEAHARAPGGDCYRRDRRQLVAFVTVAHDGGTALRRPSFPHVRNQQKAAFIKKHEVSAPAVGVFLYAATSSFSIVRSPLRPVEGPAAPAFGYSRGGCVATASTPRRDCSGLETASGSASRCASGSTTRLYTRRPGHLAAVRPGGAPAGPPSTEAAGPDWAEHGAPCAGRDDAPASTEQPSSRRLRPS
jgi:hypothetical protein